MFEIDKTAFGAFLAEQRKVKGCTQKTLAEKLFVSDKAVSKWERGLSMPDISLLIPLAEILDVSVTELLEGRRLDHTSEMDTAQVEVLVKKALSFSEDTPEKNTRRLKRHAAIFGSCAAAALLELILGISIWPSVIQRDIFFTDFANQLILTLELLTFLFGVYFWFFLKDRLPTYYDENKISAVIDAGFMLHVPGMHFNNSNWPHLTKFLRNWSAATLVILPPSWMLLSALALTLAPGFELFLGAQIAALAAYFGGLFVPIYIVGKKFE